MEKPLFERTGDGLSTWQGLMKLAETRAVRISK